MLAPLVDFDTALDIFKEIEFQRHGRKGSLKMPENQYDAPAMEVIELGKEDAICTFGSYDDCGPGIGAEQGDNGGGC